MPKYNAYRANWRGFDKLNKEPLDEETARKIEKKYNNVVILTLEEDRKSKELEFFMEQEEKRKREEKCRYCGK